MTVHDENGRKYEINAKNKLGEGGQGAVYTVPNDRRIAIKTLIVPGRDSVSKQGNDDVILQDDTYYNRYAQKIRHIMAIDAITGVKNLATPIAMLAKPYCGYVMRFMNDMENISCQMRRSGREIIPLADSNTSLLKKLRVLTNLSKIILSMNAHGLVYCDFSPGNIFVSKGIDSHEVWLIDTDNLHFAGKMSGAIGTPRYRAPEIANGTQRGNDFYSDIYSFALLAYEYLTLSSPFCGVMSQEEDENAWDAVAADDAASGVDFDSRVENGEIPFVYENKGNGPISESGIPPEYVFTDSLFDLFLRTFGETGRKHPKTRPLAGEWHEALEEALNSVTVCSNNHTHLGTVCPWCEYENSINPNRRARDQNRYFSLVSEDYVEADSESSWDADETAPAVKYYAQHRKLISHRKDKTTRVDLPGYFVSNHDPAAGVHIEIKAKRLTLEMKGARISPAFVTWEYKDEPNGKAVLIKEDGAPAKIIQLQWENADAEIEGA